MELNQNIQPIFLRELEIKQKKAKKETMTLEQAISFIEKRNESAAFENKDVIPQELIMQPLLKMANRI